MTVELQALQLWTDTIYSNEDVDLQMQYQVRKRAPWRSKLEPMEYDVNIWRIGFNQ